MFNNPEIRIHGTGSLFPIGQEDLLFHPRMIRTAGRGRDLSETKEKELSTKGHEGRRRATKALEKAQEGSAKSRGWG